VDFFCGAGGFTRGALDAGAYVLAGLDRDPEVEETYLGNNRNRDGRRPGFLRNDLHEVEPSQILQALDSAARPLAFVGCPPCQPFTNLKTDKTRSHDDRGALHRFLDFVEHFLPDYVVVENVPGIRSGKYGSLWRDAVSRLTAQGYQVREEVLDAKHYGVPQNRRRVLLVAARGAMPPWPSPTHTSQEPRTVRDTIIGLEPLEAGQASATDPLHVASILSSLNLQRLRAIRTPGGSRNQWPEELGLACYRSHTGHTDVYGRMHWYQPAPTLTTRFVSISNGRFGHPEQDRAITPREGALLQTFPRGYEFRAKARDTRVKHIGNAVPPLMARRVFEAIIAHAAQRNQG
jgi:DNA (cytosine-5)-methyltransferase 1